MVGKFLEILHLGLSSMWSLFIPKGFAAQLNSQDSAQVRDSTSQELVNRATCRTTETIRIKREVVTYTFTVAARETDFSILKARWMWQQYSDISYVWYDIVIM